MHGRWAGLYYVKDSKANVACIDNYCFPKASVNKNIMPCRGPRRKKGYEILGQKEEKKEGREKKRKGVKEGEKGQKSKDLMTSRDSCPLFLPPPPWKRQEFRVDARGCSQEW